MGKRGNKQYVLLVKTFNLIGTDGDAFIKKKRSHETNKSLFLIKMV